MANVILRDVVKRFGEVIAVNRVTLNIADQEFLVLVGPSGCGKTTTLRMIAGLEDVDAGEIYINDRLINRVPPKNRNIAMVFQNYALYPHMTVFDNMSFGLKMRNVSADQRKALVNKTADILGITQLLQRKPKELSGGQRQRVALGRAIIREPDVFLFDEPLSNLDAKLRVQMRTELRKLHERLLSTAVYVTHDQVEAMTMGDRIVVLRDGVIQQVGTPLDLYDRPSNIFVAGFIGSPAMNFIQCSVLAEGGKLFIDARDFRLPVPEYFVKRIVSSDEKQLVVGIRPEHLAKKGGENITSQDLATITVDVNVVEILGKELCLDVSVGKQILTALIDADTPVKAHQTMELMPKLERLHFFSKGSGKAI